MQILFAKNRDSELSDRMAMRTFETSLNTTFYQYLLNLYVMIGVFRVAEKDTDRRSTKHIKSEVDEKFSDRLFTNEFVQSIFNHKELNKKFKDNHLEASVDKSNFRSIYKSFGKEDFYLEYAIADEVSKEQHIELLHELYRNIRKNEIFNELMEDHSATWKDDKSLVIGAIKKTLKALPLDPDYLTKLEIPEETYEFGIKLLNRVLQEDEELGNIFEPTLKNWDIERLAILDVILLKMAICEFLHFDSIPTKVTLNEYVEIAKVYSTSKSKDFINGILDKVMRELDDQGKINKSGRGLMD